MADLGRKYNCYSCHTKFYDLGKPVPLCPKCNADQRDADEAPVYTAPRRGRAAVEPPPPPIDDDEIAPAAPAGGEEGEDEYVAPEEEREEDADEEEEEY